MVNKVILLGRVGKDPESKTFDKGNITTFTLATSEKYANKQGEKVENTEWHNCQAWGALAKIIDGYVTKGQQLYVEGKLKTESWEKDGQKHYKTIIIVESIQMLGGKPANNEQSNNSQQPVSPKDEPADDLPF